MTVDLAEQLPLAQRLALSYAPRAARGPALALLALDQRLAAILRSGGEPMLTQIKLAWWRERLAQDPQTWPKGEPLLALLRDFPGGTSPLAQVVDGWEVLLRETLDRPAITEFATGRAAGWQALGGGEVARAWALADLLLNLPDGPEADAVRAVLQEGQAGIVHMPRELRSLLVLNALAQRALRRGAGELLDGPGALLCAMRLGIFGR